MGFIEDLRKQKAAGEEARKSKLVVEEQIEGKIRKDRQKSIDFFYDSPLSAILAEIGSYYIYDDAPMNYDFKTHRFEGRPGHHKKSKNYNDEEPKWLCWKLKSTYPFTKRPNGWGNGLDYLDVDFRLKEGNAMWITDFTAIGSRICPDGKIIIVGKEIEQLPYSLHDNKREVLEQAVERALMNPFKIHISHYGYAGPSTDGGPCLPGDSLISVPNGFVPVKNLNSGDLVWTVDRFGHKIQVSIIQKAKRVVSKNHKMAHIVLKDGRELIVSPGHPTIDNREIGNLVKGQILDKSQIVSVEIMPYREKYTYDILPSGDSGGYWANNILIGSTLSNQFKQKNFGACYFV